MLNVLKTGALTVALALVFQPSATTMTESQTSAGPVVQLAGIANGRPKIN